MPLIPSLVIKLKYNSGINKRYIHLLASLLFRNLPLSYELRKEIVTKLRVVFVKNETVQSILCNYKTYANSFNMTPPECVCNTTNNNHKILYPDVLPLEDKEIFLQNGKTHQDQKMESC